MNTRHDEISIADAFSHHGYKTGWIGKWHLHRGAFPNINTPDYVPEGRDRFGFQYWRAYNFHMQYFNGWVNLDDWKYEQWKGYETDALNKYAFEFLDTVGRDPFCLFVSPHQPHATPGDFAPAEYYREIPQQISLPEGVERTETILQQYRNYYAMINALDVMFGEILSKLKENNLLDDTIIIFTSDHGTQSGEQGIPFWAKNSPFQGSLHVPFIIRYPDLFKSGIRNDTLVAPVDLFPTLCGLCEIPVPETIEGYNLSDVFVGKENAFQQEAILTMNFSAAYNHLKDGLEWRGVRTKTYNYFTSLQERTELFDLQNDPFESNNVINDSEYRQVRTDMEIRLNQLMKSRNDELVPCTSYKNWFDEKRRVIRNAYGKLNHPESSFDRRLIENGVRLDKWVLRQ